MPTITRLPGPLGAEITDLDLSYPVDAETFAVIEHALHEHGVLCIRDQTNLSPEQHIAFSRLLGELEVHVQASFLLSGHPEIYCISNCVDENGKPLGLAEAGRVWHTDLSYMQSPSRCSLLHAIEVPHEDNGKPLGDTVFASARVAYAALPESTRKRIKDLKAVHRYAYIYDRINAVSKPGRQGLKPLSDEQKKRVPPAIHPLVIAHPYTGEPILFCNDGTTEQILDLPEAESATLLKALCGHVVKPAFTYRHQWRVGDLMIWDNIQTQHLAVDDYWLPQRRYMQRTTVMGVAPQAA